jgi:hypothetical protein
MTEPLKTDGWAYLNIANPLCAWAAYRGALVSIPSEPGFISVWSASLLKSGSIDRIAREAAIERCRAQFYPQRVSRLRGMYCFDDLGSAERALEWGAHFRVSNLAELSFAEVARGDRLDSNWITHGDFSDPQNAASFGYWSGQEFPGREPVWETLVEGRIYVLGTSLRERAYELVERHMPDATPLLEIGRVAAWIGYDVGAVFAFLRDAGEYVDLNYCMSMADAENPDFLKKLEALRASGHPFRPEASKAFAEDRVRMPDLRPFGFRKLKSELPFVGPQPQLSVLPSG